MERRRRIVRKQITFNIDDLNQRELLEYARNLDNFSGRVKKLLREDYERHLRIQQLEKEGGFKINIGTGKLTVK